jgi:GNAT superfamily N-acetyltransferase
MHSITSEDHNVREVAADLADRLTRFNEAHAGPLRTRHIALTVRNEEDAMIAGLAGEIFWNALYVHLLWVDEDYRQQGYGASLLSRAEELAIEAWCRCVYLSTFEFQAPGFYAKQGYSLIGELMGVPHGSRRQWLCKMLQNRDEAPNAELPNSEL